MSVRLCSLLVAVAALLCRLPGPVTAFNILEDVKRFDLSEPIGLDDVTGKPLHTIDHERMSQRAARTMSEALHYLWSGQQEHSNRQLKHGPHVTLLHADGPQGVPVHKPRARILLQGLGQRFDLQLTRHDALISPDFVFISGDQKTSAVENCYYYGHSRHHPNSLVAVQTCRGVSGFIIANGERYHVQPLEHHVSQTGQHRLTLSAQAAQGRGTHVMWKDADLTVDAAVKCGLDDTHPQEGGDQHHDHHHHNHDLVQRIKAATASVHRNLPVKVEGATRQVLSNKVEGDAHAHSSGPDHKEEDHGRMSLSSCTTGATGVTDPNGCECKDSWTNNGQTFCRASGPCGNPDNDSNGPWCFTKASCAGRNYGYCAQATSGATCTTSPFADYAPTTCTCKDQWTFNGVTTCGRKCANPDSDNNGPWCFTEGCSSNYVYCQKQTSSPSCSSNSFTSYTPPTGCECKDTWTYNSKTICNGKCGNPDSDTNGPWCFTKATCGGNNYGYCKAPSSGGGGSSGGGSGSTAPPPSNSGRVVELLLVSDAQLTSDIAGSFGNAYSNNVQNYLIDIANGVATLYKDATLGLDIQISLKVILAWDLAAETSAGVLRGGESRPSLSMNTVLDRFTTWRDNNNQGALANDNAQLISRIQRSGSTTGLAWVGTMCRTSSTGVNEALVSEAYTIDTVAHEMGHNWGASHDSSGNTCASSGSIMAAVGVTSSGGNARWSSCSKSYIRNMLQQLEAQSNNCLRNSPSTIVGGARCGDGIVSSGEQCDSSASNCVNCQLVGNAQCGAGECCNVNTGRFKAAGTRCRVASSDCDLEERCSGSSASCGTNYVKRDGTRCTSAGPNSKCYNGNCMGYDKQCRATWSGYTGNWVHGGRNGKPGSCESKCGELQCTNTEWNDYCYTYNCQAGYRCTVGEVVLSGPASKDICQCLKAQNSPTKVYVQPGTPCSTSGDSICLNRGCVARPETLVTGCASDAQCSNRGTCAADGSCACNPPYYGTSCQNQYTCPYDCDSLNRVACVSDLYCGECKARFGTEALEYGNTTKCNLLVPSSVRITASLTAGINTAERALDFDPGTYWEASFLNNTAIGKGQELPYLQVEFDRPFQLHRYQIWSADQNAGLDPKAWELEGSVDGNRWVLLDTRTEQYWDRRSFPLTFAPKENVLASKYRLFVTAVREVANQGAVTLDPVQEVVDTGTVANITFNSTVVGAYVPRVRIAEFQLQQDTEAAGVGSSSSEGNDAAVVGAVVGTLCGVLLIGALLFVYVRRRRGQQAKRVQHVSSAISLADHTRASRILTSKPDIHQGQYHPSIAGPIKPSARLPSAMLSESVLGAARQHAVETYGPYDPVEEDETVLERSGAWVCYRNEQGIPYYYNEQTGKSVWEKPY